MIGESCFNIIKALIVRAALALHTILTVWRVTENLNDSMYWLLCCLMVPFIVEGIYSIVRRKGKEYLWFSPCFFFYLCGTLPPIWLLELDKSKQVRDHGNTSLTPAEQLARENDTHVDLAAVTGISVDLNPNMWTIVIEEMLLYLLVIGRWILPRGEVTREQLSELLFAFIGIAADVMEFFSLFGEQQVRKNEVLGYLLLSIWSLSILQFTMAVTVTQQPKRAKKIKTVKAKSDDEPPDEQEQSKLSSELGAIFISMAMQDVPFLVLRLYTIITYNLIDYSLIFFTSKNVLVISLLFYKVAVILQLRYCPHWEGVKKDDDIDDEKIVGVGGEKNGDGGGDDASEEDSSPSKYALPYEYPSMVPTAGKGNGELTHRNASKSSRDDTASNKSSDKLSKGSVGSKPNGLTIGDGRGSDKKTPSPRSLKTPASTNGEAIGMSPTPSKSSSSGKTSGGVSSPSTPHSVGSPASEGRDFINPARPANLGSPREASKPVIISPTKQDAKPGDPNFKPYTSVVQIP